MDEFDFWDIIFFKKQYQFRYDALNSRTFLQLDKKQSDDEAAQTEFFILINLSFGEVDGSILKLLLDSVNFQIHILMHFAYTHACVCRYDQPVRWINNSGEWDFEFYARRIFEIRDFDTVGILTLGWFGGKPKKLYRHLNIKNLKWKKKF